MRTTLSIDDQLLAEAKRRAQESGITLGAFVEDALRSAFATPRRRHGRVHLTTSTATGGPRAGVDLTSNRGLYDAMGTDVA